MTKQKQVVYMAVTNSSDHPTAEQVLVRARTLMPSINLATVYRNLTALEKENKIQRIHSEKGDRFDKTLCDHAHFRCEKCGEFFDLEGVDLKKVIDNLKKSIHNINNVDFVVTGTCLGCKNTN